MVCRALSAGSAWHGERQAYLKGTPFNACLLFGLHITAIGQLGGARDDAEPEMVQHMSRGSSEVWATRPHAYVNAWAEAGPKCVRLSLSANRLVGALVVGQQTLADPLRELIEKLIDIRPVRRHLEQGGPAMVQVIQRFWMQIKASAQALRPMPGLSSRLIAQPGQQGSHS